MTHRKQNKEKRVLSPQVQSIIKRLKAHNNMRHITDKEDDKENEDQDNTRRTLFNTPDITTENENTSDEFTGDVDEIVWE